MTGWEVIGIVVALFIVIGFLTNLRDIIRYFRIRSM